MSERALATDEDQLAELGDERTRIDKLGRIRELIFGSLDGLLVPLGVISGVAGGTGDSKAVIVAGVAEAFAGALSMGAGEFISGRAKAQVHRKEIEQELRKIRHVPGYEQWEMEQLFRGEGVGGEDSRQLASTLARYPRAFAHAMVSLELGLQLDPETVRISQAMTMATSYIVGSVFPLLAYFFLPVRQAIPVSLVLSFVALLAIGAIKGKLASLNIGRSILEILLVAAASAGGGYLLGSVVPRLLGY